MCAVQCTVYRAPSTAKALTVVDRCAAVHRVPSRPTQHLQLPRLGHCICAVLSLHFPRPIPGMVAAELLHCVHSSPPSSLAQTLCSLVLDGLCGPATANLQP